MTQYADLAAAETAIDSTIRSKTVTDQVINDPDHADLLYNIADTLFAQSAKTLFFAQPDPPLDATGQNGDYAFTSSQKWYTKSSNTWTLSQALNTGSYFGPFNDTKIYAQYDLVIYSGTLYYANTARPAESFDPMHWTAIIEKSNLITTNDVISSVPTNIQTWYDANVGTGLTFDQEQELNDIIDFTTNANSTQRSLAIRKAADSWAVFPKVWWHFEGDASQMAALDPSAPGNANKTYWVTTSNDKSLYPRGFYTATAGSWTASMTFDKPDPTVGTPFELTTRTASDLAILPLLSEMNAIVGGVYTNSKFDLVKVTLPNNAIEWYQNDGTKWVGPYFYESNTQRPPYKTVDDTAARDALAPQFNIGDLAWIQDKSVGLTFVLYQVYDNAGVNAWQVV